MRQSEAVVYAVACALVIYRSAVFVFYEQAHFDSDQAILGLMALDLSRFEAFPLFFYGQRYMLGVESWMAAPFVAALGTTVLALKLPLLLLNCVTAAVLVRMLIREAGLRPFEALAAASFFVLAPPVTASRLVEATGVNIEPFAYVLALWLLRRRPWIFGFVLGVAWLHREFTIYSAGALIVMAVLEGRLFARETLRFAARAAIAFAAVLAAVALLTPYASNHFDTAVRPGPTFDGFGAALDRLAAALRAVAVIVGAAPLPLATFNISSRLTTGHVWMMAPLAVLLVVTLAGVTRRRLRDLPRLPLYLLLVGVQAVAVHALFATGDAMLIRYSLLSLLIPVGLAGLLGGAPRPLVLTAAACAAAWSAGSLFDHVRLVDEYNRRRPPNEHRELAMYLEANGVRTGHAPYWTAYHVTYLTGMRVALSSPEFVRIPALEEAVAADPNAVEIRLEPCPSIPAASARSLRGGETRIRRWYICR